MNVPLPILFFLAMLLLGLERLIPTTIPAWIVGVILLIVGVVGLIGAT